MAGADGPTRLLEVCGQRLSRFLHDAEHKRLAWLREAEEQGMRLLDSNFGAEPQLMPKTPSQRRRPRRRQSSCLKDENKEPNRRRLSRRRSSIKMVSSKPNSQRRHGKEHPQNPSCGEEEVPMPDCVARSQASVKTELPALVGKWPVEAQGPPAEADCQDCPRGAGSSDAACRAVTGEPWLKGDAATELHDVSSVTEVPDGQAAREWEEAPKKRPSTSTPKAARNGDPAMLQGDPSPEGFEKILFQDSDSKTTPVRSKTRRCSGCRSFVGGPHKSRRASLAEKYSLASKRESMIRRSISRAISKKAAARESSSASSRVSSLWLPHAWAAVFRPSSAVGPSLGLSFAAAGQSSLEVFVEEDVTSSMRPGLDLNPPSEKPQRHTDQGVNMGVCGKSRTCVETKPPLTSQGSRVNPNSECQNENQEQPHCAKSQENPSCIWMRSYKQAMGIIQNGQQPGGQTLSPLDDKHKNSANQNLSSSSPASKVARPLKNFLQAVQRNQLFASAGPTGRGGVVKNFIKCSTPTRPDLKEKERQRLESLRKKQEAEEQRKKKVEEEKRRRQAEMKQKREERLRKALQARERVEQMEEEKKKRMERKILQTDEKVHASQGREEKVAEERSKRKLSKKHGEADVWKQKALRMEEDEFEQQEPLQKRREDEVKEKGKKNLELKNLVEQQQVEQVKERDYKQQGKEKASQPQLESAVFTEKNLKEEESPRVLRQQPGQKSTKQPECTAVASNTWGKAVKEEDGLQKHQQQLGEEKKIKHPEALTASGTWLSKTAKKSISTSCLGPPEGAKESGSPQVNINNYGMDLNSDDSTDDENDPRKPVPAWADGYQLNQAILHQYYHPVNVDQLFGLIPSPKLEDIFGKSKPRYFKRTSSAVWHSPPGTKSTCGPSCNFKN
ncbi:inner centromere protein-like isoform X2 [Phalacrocorax aristotelis]|uniref:inner centromere protein-like isoform X2 n=1 Tax=Phalacrocorax aristotelis TaxID=126867 RepID=UPI003F4BFAA1